MYDDNLFAVDTTGVEQMGGYEVLPAGLYPAVMISAAKKPTKNGDGAYLECVYQIIDGDMSGKKYTSRLNLWNQNSTAVEIAKRELKSLRTALGLHDQESRTDAFVNKPLVLNIGVKARKDKPDVAENNLIGIEGYGPVQQAPAQNYAPPPQQTFAPPPQQYQQQRPAAPAFQPNAQQTPPWMAGAR